MLTLDLIVTLALLVPLAFIIAYYDVRYRRIPNVYVLATLISGLILNSLFGGVSGFASSLAGCALAFALLFVFHLFGAMGAGDVKLFAAIGAVLGYKLVLPTFAVIVLIGGLLAVYTMVRAGNVRNTLFGVLQIFIGLMPDWKMPKFEVPTNRRHTIPYGVASTEAGDSVRDNDEGRRRSISQRAERSERFSNCFIQTESGLHHGSYSALRYGDDTERHHAFASDKQSWRNARRRATRKS